MDWDADPPLSSSFIYSTTREAEARKPPGLKAEAVGSLPREVYGCPGGAAAGPPECCICLERFHKGDSLVRLPCGHKFHGDCLSPWLRGCGDCPYCRFRIVSDAPAAHVTGPEVPF
ncbi:unnamed protein product [Spirodela intermedia]|uniref:RING-type domain-containing protein n=1 Tax=Spirodela intermedia TaxID=51605 RepID=A0A7I8L2H7_SPIIN|nr:unnamed protein product [Spirodela intermedia]